MNNCRRVITLSVSQCGLLKSTSIGFSHKTAVKVGQTVILKGNENFSSRPKLSLQYYSTESAKDDTTKRLDTLVNESKVVVFMKGVPTQPMCGFSNAVVQVLRMHGVEYKAHNVLDDEAIRQGIKDYSNWPTIPQVYVGGNFVGGCDILLQMHRSGELVEELEKVGIRSALLDEEEGKPKPDKTD